MNKIISLFNSISTIYIDRIIICTSTNPQDDPLENIANQESVHCFRGSEDDVLLRLYEAAETHDLSFFANITADCPLIDPTLIDYIVKKHCNTDNHLTMFNNENNDLK